MYYYNRPSDGRYLAPRNATRPFGRNSPIPQGPAAACARISFSSRRLAANASPRPCAPASLGPTDRRRTTRSAWSSARCPWSSRIPRSSPTCARPARARNRSAEATRASARTEPPSSAHSGPRVSAFAQLPAPAVYRGS